jgi:hypothetical protein
LNARHLYRRAIGQAASGIRGAYTASEDRSYRYRTETMREQQAKRDEPSTSMQSFQVSCDRNTAYYDYVTVITAIRRSQRHPAHGCGMIRTINRRYEDESFYERLC